MVFLTSDSVVPIFHEVLLYIIYFCFDKREVAL